MKTLKKLALLPLFSGLLLTSACNNNDDGDSPIETTVAVTGVTLNPATASLTVGNELTLTATVLPENATNQNVIWTSNDNAIATVENGVVTAIADGDVIITVTTVDGDFYATSEIEITPATISVESVTLNQAVARLIIGENIFALTATVLPEDAVNQNITWTSSDEAIATVEDGVVTTISSGTAIITVTTEDGGKTATSTVTVFTAQGCNFNTPGWGENGLGTITWGSTTNTDIDYGATTILGTGGRPTQVWSDAVFATACAKGNTTSGNEFNGGSTGNFNADCRQTRHTFEAGRATAITGDLFSWCAVMRFADQLCPYPWRVPTMEDFGNLHQNLGFELPNPGIQVQHFNFGDFLPTVGTVAVPQRGGRWNAVRLIGNATSLTNAGTNYWASTETNASNARHIMVNSTIVIPQASSNKNLGYAVRCVR